MALAGFGVGAHLVGWLDREQAREETLIDPLGVKHAGVVSGRTFVTNQVQLLHAHRWRSAPRVTGT